MLAPMVIGQPAGQPQPLAALLRDLVADDAELREQLAEARRRRLARLTVVKLAPEISPADFTEAALARIPERTPAPVWGFGITNPWATWIALNIRRRMAEIIAGAFDQLRRAELVATGFVPATGGRTCVPADLWHSEAAALDMRANTLLAGAAVLFIDVVVSRPESQPRSASRATLDRFTRAFDEAMRDADRRYTLDEIIAAARATLGNVSRQEIEAALKRMSPAARAGAGRRAAHEVPTEAELTAAASRAAEASSNPA